MSTAHPASIDPPASCDGTAGSRSLADLFRHVCGSHGGRIAVTLASESLSYAELDLASDRVAASLQERGAGAGSIVAICVERSLDMIVSMLGVVKSGAAYLPLDPGYPAARLAETIADATPLAVITSPGLAERLGNVQTPLLLAGDLQSARPLASPVAIRPDDPAYIIYTSGSTGRSKGVIVSHRNVTRLFAETARWFRFSPDDVWTMFHSFAFDFSVWEIWGALLTGGRLVIVPFGVCRSPEEFHRLLVEEQVTVLNQTPSAFVLLDQLDGKVAPNRTPLSQSALRIVIFGGEALAPASLRGWFARHGDTSPMIFNMYGITETTVHVSCRRMLVADAARERESLIGEPLPDLEIRLLNAQLQPVARGEEGEICVSGPGVAQGYLRRVALSAERFPYDPSGAPGSRLYRSGDLGRRREDGELVYLGRRDWQVKINGFRIELGEIETALLTHPSLVQVCVVAHAAPGESPRLAAYFVAQHGLEPSTRELSEYLSQRLPAQMMPAFYQRLAVFPLTPNGKVDRGALPAPRADSAVPHRRSAAAPATLEDLVAGVWRVVLKTRAVGLDDNFFDVGGTSLLLIAVRTGLQEHLERPIPVTWMFECTTVRSLAGRLAEPVASPDSRQASAAPQTPAMLEDRVRKQRLAFSRARAARSASL